MSNYDTTGTASAHELNINDLGIAEDAPENPLADALEPSNFSGAVIDPGRS